MFKTAFRRPAGPARLRGVPRFGRLDPERAKIMARSPRPKIRALVAAHPATPVELLYFLVRDPAIAVRRSLAGNIAAPRQADLILALDADTGVRQMLARKIAENLPQMSRESAQAWALGLPILAALAKDDVAGIRRLLADAARNIELVPAEILTRLARDRDSGVAVSALGYVGRMADADLVGIVEDAPDQRVIGAVARRPAIGEAVSQAVVDLGDDAAVSALLDNRDARIAQDALDRAAARAAQASGGKGWQERIFQRRASDRAAPFPASAVPLSGQVIDPQTPLERARKLQSEQRLTEEAVESAIATDPAFVTAALAVRSGVPIRVARRIVAANSAKALTALVWKAGLSMRLSFQLQLRLLRLPAKARLSPTGAGFPMNDEEMIWQIEFYKTLAAKE